MILTPEGKVRIVGRPDDVGEVRQPNGEWEVFRMRFVGPDSLEYELRDFKVLELCLQEELQTYAILRLITSAALSLNRARIGFDLTKHLRQSSIIRVPGILTLKNHCRQTHATGPACRRYPHDLDLRLGKVIRLRYRVDAVIVEAGQRIAKQLEPTNALRTSNEGACILGRPTGRLGRKHKVGKLL